MAGEGVEHYQRDVGREDDRAQADAEVPVEGEGPEGVPGQEGKDDYGQVEGEAVEVLEDVREPALAGVVLAGGHLLHGAGWGVPEEGPVVGQAVVVAGQPEAEREEDDVERRGDRPAADAPAGDEQRRIEGGEVGPDLVEPVLQPAPGRVEDE